MCEFELQIESAGCRLRPNSPGDTHQHKRPEYMGLTSPVSRMVYTPLNTSGMNWNSDCVSVADLTNAPVAE